ncbi:hypothetical protein [Chondromyces crocatus]|uniref:hypothetical protein n=1 Tax=Chondromyces crocatus TaxID=52 RepID=UPI00067B5B4F|nr:hypothetical protein [Chondromyces crocatus]
MTFRGTSCPAGHNLRRQGALGAQGVAEEEPNDSLREAFLGASSALRPEEEAAVAAAHPSVRHLSAVVAVERPPDRVPVGEVPEGSVFSLPHPGGQAVAEAEPPDEPEVVEMSQALVEASHSPAAHRMRLVVAVAAALPESPPGEAVAARLVPSCKRVVAEQARSSTAAAASAVEAPEAAESHQRHSRRAGQSQAHHRRGRQPMAPADCSSAAERTASSTH